MNAILPQTTMHSLSPTNISVYNPLLQGLPQQPQLPQGHFLIKHLKKCQGLPYPAMNAILPQTIMHSLSPTYISVYNPLLQGLPQQPQQPQGHFLIKHLKNVKAYLTLP